jgi:hypothetical protein
MQRLAKSWSVMARRFESCIFRQVCWPLAQLVEHPTLTRSVASSILARSAIYFQSNSSAVERRPHKALVGGSCPPWTTKFFCLVSSIGSEHRFTTPGVARSNRVRGASIGLRAALVTAGDCKSSASAYLVRFQGNPPFFASLAQWQSVPLSRGMSPVQSRHGAPFFAVIAQLVERSVEGAGVVGSIPAHGTI